MAGYLISLNNLTSLDLYTRNGVYATKLSAPQNRLWKGHHEGTFADYATMRAGDNIYFFIQRKIYGIGKLVDIGPDCKFFNFPDAAKPHNVSYSSIKHQLLWDETNESVNQRCVCFFEPDPHFFTHGIDMDDVLSSNPNAFKMLRVFWKLSFIKFDDEENQAFRDIILKRNENAMAGGTSTFTFQSHPASAVRISPTHAFDPGIAEVLASCAAGDRLKHEMAIEAGLLHQLSIMHKTTCDVLGRWDYLSHQVVASPFKPVDYMDKMDLFGYSYVPGFKPTKARFLVAEIKRDMGWQQDIDQLMKYVDWVRDEYCHGDYAMIRAFLIAHEFDTNAITHKQTAGVRSYTIGVRPAQSLEWRDLKLVRYAFNSTSRCIDVEVIG